MAKSKKNFLEIELNLKPTKEESNVLLCACDPMLAKWNHKKYRGVRWKLGATFPEKSQICKVGNNIKGFDLPFNKKGPKKKGRVYEMTCYRDNPLNTIYPYEVSIEWPPPSCGDISPLRPVSKKDPTFIDEKGGSVISGTKPRKRPAK